MPKFAQGLYRIKNPQKYVGNRAPRYRSSWELVFMRFCDLNEHVLQWASEAIHIPYRHPLTGKQTIYVPDFLITYRTQNNTVQAELIEIKPRRQSMIEDKMNSRDRAVVAVNHAKWAAAAAFCKKQGLHFRVVTENDIWRQSGK
jgi:hypothetical protein